MNEPHHLCRSTPNAPETSPDDTAEDTLGNLDTLWQEVERLEREGRLTMKALSRIQAKLHALSVESDQRVSESISRLLASLGSKPAVADKSCESNQHGKQRRWEAEFYKETLGRREATMQKLGELKYSISLWRKAAPFLIVLNIVAILCGYALGASWAKSMLPLIFVLTVVVVVMAWLRPGVFRFDHQASRKAPATPLPDSDTATNSTATIAKYDAILEEARQLESTSRLDDKAVRRIEENLRAVFERNEPKHPDILSSFRADRVHPFTVGGWRKAVLFLGLLALLGGMLHVALGARFISSWRNQFDSSLPILYALTLPAFGAAWFHLAKKGVLSSRFPTKWIRWLFAYPMMVVLSSSMLVYSPLGWSALAAWAIGAHDQPRQAVVLSVAPIGRTAKGGCNQKAVLEIGDIQSPICIENRVVGPTPKAGDTVWLYGQSSFLGLFIEEIHVQHP